MSGQHRADVPGEVITARKAIGAAIGAGLGALGSVMLDGDLTRAEAIASAGSAILAGGAAWALPYAVPKRSARP